VCDSYIVSMRVILCRAQFCLYEMSCVVRFARPASASALYRLTMRVVGRAGAGEVKLCREELLLSFQDLVIARFARDVPLRGKFYRCLQRAHLAV